MITSNKIDVGFFSAPNLVPWLLFNVNILGVGAWIVTDEFCRIRFLFNLKGRDMRKSRWREAVGRGGGGCDYSRKAINRGMAIIRGNTVFLSHPDCTYLARTKIMSMIGTDSLLDLLAEVSHFSSHFCLVVRDLFKQGRYWVLIENRKKKTLNEKSQCVLIAKISFRKTEKITNPQK